MKNKSSIFFKNLLSLILVLGISGMVYSKNESLNQINLCEESDVEIDIELDGEKKVNEFHFDGSDGNDSFLLPEIGFHIKTYSYFADSVLSVNGSVTPKNPLYILYHQLKLDC